MNEEKKIIQLDTAQTEDRLKEALPVLSAPESLNAENVARALSGVKKARRIPLGKYVGAAVAAVLVLAIGIGAMSSGILGGFGKKEAVMAPDVTGIPPVSDDGVKEYAANIGTDGTGGVFLDPDSGIVMMELDGVVYVGDLAGAVDFDDGARRYLGSEWLVGDSMSEATTTAVPQNAGKTAGPEMRWYLPADGDTDADLCAVTTLEDGRQVILFLYEYEACPAE